MQLNSYEFITILLPLTLIFYFSIGRINAVLRKLVLCISGAVVFAYVGIKGFVILAISMAVNFLLAEMMLESEKLRKFILVISIAANIALLIVFKYSNFIIGNINLITGKNIDFLNLSMPLGISFFTFQQLYYQIFIYRSNPGKLKFLDYAAYILYFPKLIMGPIADPEDLISQINNPEVRIFKTENFVSGIKLFSFGLFKKMILADSFAKAVAWGSENISSASSLDWIIIMLCYTFEIYFDFSGYSDMAIGVSCMMNIELPINFDSPYKAVSVGDFWDRWHMSLTKFLTKNIYIPLGGSRKGTLRTYINIAIVFLISGIWHGANWTFILWGGLYGILSIADRIIEPLWNKTLKPVKWFTTFTIINVLWLLFNSASITEWVTIMKTVALGKNFALSPALTQCFYTEALQALTEYIHMDIFNIKLFGIAWMTIFLVGSLLLCLIGENNYRTKEKFSFWNMIFAALAFAISFISLGTESVFIYNNF